MKFKKVHHGEQPNIHCNEIIYYSMVSLNNKTISNNTFGKYIFFQTFKKIDKACMKRSQ